jgi:hypothetical protein
MFRFKMKEGGRFDLAPRLTSSLLRMVSLRLLAGEREGAHARGSGLGGRGPRGGVPRSAHPRKDEQLRNKRDATAKYHRTVVLIR